MENQNSGKKIIWLIIGIVIVALLVWWGFSGIDDKISEEGSIVKIGVIAPMSGDAAAYGEDLQKIITYRVDETNKNGGKDGIKFEAVFEDGKCSGNDAVNAFQKLTTIDGVKFIVGGFCSSETMAIAPLATENKILAISPGSSNPAIEGLSPYVFSLSYSDSKTGEDLAKEASVFKRVAIISEQNDFNIGIRDVFVSSMNTYPKTSIVSNEMFPKGSADFRSLLEKIRTKNPDAIVLNPNPGVTAENLLKQLAEITSWKGYALLSISSYLSDTTRTEVGSFANGMIIIDSPNVASASLDEIKAKIEDQEGGLSTMTTYYIASILDSIDMAMNLVGKVGNDPEVAQKELSSGLWDGFIGSISFQGKNFVRITSSGKYVVENGKAVFKSEQ